MIRILVFGISLVAAGVAAWFALALQPEPESPNVVQPAPEPTLEILVASASMPPGHVLAAADVAWSPWPQSHVRPYHTTREAQPEAAVELAGAFVRSEILPGEPVRQEKLIRTEAGFLATRIPADRRAIAVRISPATTAGGFIQPNDRVDVLFTSTELVSDARGPQTRSVTLLSNVKVLAIGQAVQVADTNTAFGPTATLELTPEQAEILTSAERSGSISLALRSFDDPSREQRIHREAGSVTMIRQGRSQVVELR